VNSATGSFDHSETDVTLPGTGVPFSFTRSYNSLDVTTGELGQGWTDTFAASLIIKANGDVTVHGEDGQQVAYTKQPDGSFVGSAGSLSTLAAVSGGYDLTQTDQTKQHFDSQGRLLSIVDRNGQGLTLAYGADGKLSTVTDAAGRTITFTHNANGLLTQITMPDTSSVGYAYNVSGQLTSFTDQRGRVWSYTYDSHGFLASETDPLNHTQFQNTYGNDGRVSQQVDALNHTTSFSWDQPTQTETVTDQRSNTWKDVYASNVLTKQIDAAGRLLTKTDPLGHQTFFGYDAVGNRTSVTDANSHTTSYTYDAAGRVLTVTAPDGGVTNYSYDGNGNALTRTDANNHTATYTYDAGNELTSKVSPLGQTWTYSYDANGNRTSIVDANGNATQTPGDGTTNYTYDHANRLKTISYSDSTPGVTYTYDANGNRAGMSDGSGNVSYAYDGLNRQTSVTRGTDSFAYSYDAAGNITSRTYPDGTVVSSSDDEDNRLISVMSGGATTTYGYDVAGDLTQTTLPASNGYTETRTYDRAGRLTDVMNANGSSVLSEFAYALDPVGNPTTVTRTGAVSSTTTYSYDASDRLTSVCFQASCPGASDPFIRWTYEHVGNRLTETRPTGTTNYSYDAADELTSAGATSYSYDHNGNETAAGSRTFSYDLANRVTSTTNGSTTTNYTYDGDGNRLSASTGAGASQVTNYLWDTNGALPQPALERDGAGALLRRYVYGNDRISMSTPAEAFYYHSDGLGSVTNVTSSSGTSEWTYTYEPFGSLRTETQNDVGAPPNTMKFAGEYLDPIALYNLRAREYDPATGRFDSLDPVSAAVTLPGQSSYAYVSNRPTLLTDPSGMTFEPSDLGESAAQLAGSQIVLFAGPEIHPCRWWGFHKVCNVGKTIWRGTVWIGGHVGHAVSVAAVWLWSLRNKWGVGDEPTIDVKISDHAVQEAADEGWTTDDVAHMLKNASGKYNGFKYQGKWGNQIGWWGPQSEMFAGSAISNDEKDLVITTVIKAPRAYVDRLIRTGWGK
jgi:RHS repeat-associated protein